MRLRNLAALAASAAIFLSVGVSSRPDARGAGSGVRKKILVELYTSQGCNSCPPASDLLGKLAGMGYGPDRVIPVNFHVDYFNEPWADPFSDPDYSRREMAYNRVQDRKDLYFTPMMMVDGRTPLLGSDRKKAVAAMDAALQEAAGVTLASSLKGSGKRRTLRVVIAAKSPEVAGRDLLIGTAVTERSISTEVPSGENGGKTLVEHHVVRAYAHKSARLDGGDSTTLEFALQLRPGQDAKQTSVAVFVQDEANGKVYQADNLPWVEATRDR